MIVIQCLAVFLSVWPVAAQLVYANKPNTCKPYKRIHTHAHPLATGILTLRSNQVMHYINTQASVTLLSTSFLRHITMPVNSIYIYEYFMNRLSKGK